VPLNVARPSEGSRKASTQSNVDDWSTDDKPKEKKKPVMPVSQPKAVGRMAAVTPAKKAAPKLDSPRSSNSDNTEASEEAPPTPTRALPKRGAAGPSRTPTGTMRSAVAAPTRAAPKFTPQADDSESQSDAGDTNGDDDTASNKGGSRQQAPPVPKRRPSMSAPKTNGPPAARRFNAPRKA
jgi:hypothetical protein